MADINQIKVKGVVYDVADEAARNAIKQKQNILIPGNNITIKDNVISANVPDTEGAVTGIIMNGKEKTPNANGMVDLGTVVTDISGKVDKEDGKGLFSGSYDDLTDKPQIPQSVTDLNDAEDYVATEQLNDKIDNINNALSEKANINDMSIESGNGSAIITLKRGVSVTVLTQHQDISGKADKSEMSVDNVTGDSTKKKVTLKQGLDVDVITEHQSLSSYATKNYVDNKLVEVTINEIANLSGDVGISNVDGTTYIMFGSSSSIEATDAPSISHSISGNAATVTITNNDDDTNAVIYYTTDGSTPTTESNVYSAPFTINSAVTVKAIAYADGKMPSAVTSHTIEGSSQPTLSISNTSTSSTITATGASGSTVYISTDGNTWISGTGTASITIQKTAAAQSVTVYAYATETGKLPSVQTSQTYNICEVVFCTVEGTCQNAAPFNVTIGSTRYPVTPTGDSAPYSWSVELENVTSLQCGDGSTNNIFGNNSDTNILSITAIPSSVTEIGIRAFANMSALTSFTTGNCAAVIKSSAFKNDNALINLTITDGCDFDENATGIFWGCNVTSIYLGAGITKIPNSCFVNNTKLTTLEIKSKNIGTSAFNGCKNITSLILHEGVETIGAYAFSMVGSGTYMSGLELVIPASCKEIEQDAFEYCKNFADVELKRYDTSDNDYPITKLSLNSGVTSTGELGISKSASFPIYVPDAALATYQADQYWSVYGARVKSINEKTS